MNASILVDKLLENEQLVSLLAIGPYGQPAIYQIVAPEADVYPRLAIYEDSREDTEFADDIPIQEVIRFRVDIFAEENVLRKIAAALHIALRTNKLVRLNDLPDDYLPEIGVFVKSSVYEFYNDLEVL